MAFKLALHGEAAGWLETLPVDCEFSLLLAAFRERFKSELNFLDCINELMDACLGPEELIMGFLDRLRGVTLRGDLIDLVLVAADLRNLPEDISRRIVLSGKPVNWNEIYSSCLIMECAQGVRSLTCQAVAHSRDRAKVLRSDVVCWACRKKGHAISKCFTFKEFMKVVVAVIAVQCAPSRS